VPLTPKQTHPTRIAHRAVACKSREPGAGGVRCLSLL
jgi:hypothetical protein